MTVGMKAFGSSYNLAIISMDLVYVSVCGAWEGGFRGHALSGKLLQAPYGDRLHETPFRCAGESFFSGGDFHQIIRFK